MIDIGERMDISVVIPTYNRQGTIERALRSVYCQTLMPKEVIVVDDCSTDGTADVVRRLQRDNPTLRLIVLEENSGAQEARNMGIRNATGDWVAFLDSDDEWLPEKTEIQVRALQDNPECGAVFSDAYFRKGLVDVYHRCANRHKKYYYAQDMLFGTEALFQTIMVRKGILAEIGYLDPNVPSYQEWDTRIRICQTTTMLYVPRPVFVYHFDQDNCISKNLKRRVDGFRYVVMKHKDLFMSTREGIWFYYEGMYHRYRDCHSIRQYYYYCKLKTVGFRFRGVFRGGCKDERIASSNEQQEKMKLFYDLLIQWLTLRQTDKGLDAYFKRHGYRTIAIYGMKELGKCLREELRNSEITIK